MGTKPGSRTGAHDPQRSHMPQSSFPERGRGQAEASGQWAAGSRPVSRKPGAALRGLGPRSPGWVGRQARPTPAGTSRNTRRPPTMQPQHLTRAGAAGPPGPVLPGVRHWLCRRLPPSRCPPLVRCPIYPRLTGPRTSSGSPPPGRSARAQQRRGRSPAQGAPALVAGARGRGRLRRKQRARSPEQSQLWCSPIPERGPPESSPSRRAAAL